MVQLALGSCGTKFAVTSVPRGRSAAIRLEYLDSNGKFVHKIDKLPRSSGLRPLETINRSAETSTDDTDGTVN